MPKERVEKLKYLRIQEEDGTIYGDIPLAIDAENVTMQNKNDLQSTIGDIDYTTEGDITVNLRRIKNDIENISNNISIIEQTKADADQVNNQLSRLGEIIEDMDLNINNLGLYHDYSTGNLYLTYKGTRGTHGVPMPFFRTQINQCIEDYLNQAIQNLDIITGGTVDSEISETSTNPLENRAIHRAIAQAVEKLQLHRPEIYFDTVEGWRSKLTLVGQKNTVYIYTDYQQDGEGNNIAGIKIGDGNAYLIDAPFLDTIYFNHINDTDIHITDEERRRWNEKVRCFYSLTDDETVIFTTD